MSKNSRVAVSIFLISMIILPAVFILGILLPMMLYQAFESTLSEFKDLFTVLGISFIVLLLIPPWDAKKRAIVSETFKKLSKGFFRPKPTDEILFKDTIVHFAATKEFSNESDLTSEIIESFLGTISVFDVKRLSSLAKGNPVNFNNTRQDFRSHTSLKTRKKTTFTDSVLDPLNKLKKSNFEPNFDLFFKLYLCNTTFLEYISFGGDNWNVHLKLGCSINALNNNMSGN